MKNLYGVPILFWEIWSFLQNKELRVLTIGMGSWAFIQKEQLTSQAKDDKRYDRGVNIAENRDTEKTLARTYMENQSIGNQAKIIKSEATKQQSTINRKFPT